MHRNPSPFCLSHNHVISIMGRACGAALVVFSELCKSSQPADILSEKQRSQSYVELWTRNVTCRPARQAVTDKLACCTFVEGRTRQTHSMDTRAAVRLTREVACNRE